MALILNASANLMMKFGVKRFQESGVKLEDGFVPFATTLGTNWVLILGLFCFAINVGFYTYALSGLKISVAYPIMFSGGFLIITLIAWKFLAETLTPGQWAGVLAIAIGVFLVARDMQTVPGGAG
jgi:multidrug transporter EmrE-like cation transporter